MTVKDQIIAIADKYCELHGITRSDLFLKHNNKNSKKRKIVNGINVSSIRMALGYYLTKYYPVSITEVAHIIGYDDHTSICANSKKIYFYIKNEDPYFMRFYKPLIEIAKLYEPVRFDRISRNQFAILK